MQAAKGQSKHRHSISDKTKVMTSIETHRLAFVASSKCLHIVKLLMFLFVLAKLLPERHNLYGNSLDFKLKYMREKNLAILD